MKNFISLVLLVAIFTGCKKENERAFDKSPEERVTETLNKYQTQLEGAQFGWKALVETKVGIPYFFYLKFSNNNRVRMYSTFDSISSVDVKESSYRLKALQQVSLLFDTYSYLHVLADPDPAVAGGAVGTGYGSDFEYYFSDSSTADTIKLIGRKNNTRTTLIRATQQEATAYDNRELGRSFLFHNLKSKVFNYWKQFTVGGTTFEIDDNSIDTIYRTITISWLDATGNKQSATTSYYFVGSGVAFTNPIVAGSQTLTGFTNLAWNSSALTLSASVNSSPVTIAGAIKGIKIDVTAPRRWWQFPLDNGNRYWASDGFRVNGVDDAFRLTTIPSYSGFTVFWPRYGTSGGVNYDLLSPITSGAINFGAAYRPPTFTTDGRVIFPFLGTLGTVPAAGNAAYVSLRTKMAEAGGFYLVQVDEAGHVYDMVSATDAKSWARWEWPF